MNYKQRNYCITKMQKYADRDDWIADMLQAPIWDDDSREEELTYLWDVINLPAKDLLAPYSIKDISEMFVIPYRTVQDWYGNRRRLAAYLRLMMKESIDRN